MKKIPPEVQKIINKESALIKKLDFHPDTEKIIKKAIDNFEGQYPTLESAIGALVLGQFVGWRVLRIIHGSNTYNKYEKILGIKFKNLCAPDTDGEGIIARRNLGFRYAKKIKSYWKVATGKVKTSGKALLADKGLDDYDISS